HSLLGIPIAFAYVISSLVVIPIAIYGISAISRMQLATQLIWVGLQFLPLVYIATRGHDDVAPRIAYPRQSSGPNSAAGSGQGTGGGLSFVPFGMPVSILLSLLPQIGEQVD